MRPTRAVGEACRQTVAGVRTVTETGAGMPPPRLASPLTFGEVGLAPVRPRRLRPLAATAAAGSTTTAAAATAATCGTATATAAGRGRGECRRDVQRVTHRDAAGQLRA